MPGTAAAARITPATSSARSSPRRSAGRSTPGVYLPSCAAPGTTACRRPRRPDRGERHCQRPAHVHSEPGDQQGLDRQHDDHAQQGEHHPGSREGSERGKRGSGERGPAQRAFLHAHDPRPGNRSEEEKTIHALACSGPVAVTSEVAMNPRRMGRHRESGRGQASAHVRGGLVVAARPGCRPDSRSVTGSVAVGSNQWVTTDTGGRYGSTPVGWWQLVAATFPTRGWGGDVHPRWRGGGDAGQRSPRRGYGASRLPGEQSAPGRLSLGNGAATRVRPSSFLQPKLYRIVTVA